MTSTPAPWIAEPLIAEESGELLTDEEHDWAAIMGDVQLTAGRVEDEIWRGRSSKHVALCRRENVALLLAAPKLLAACKLLLSVVADAVPGHSDREAACNAGKEAIAEAEGGPVTDTLILRAMGYEVKPDPDAPGKWIWRSNFHHAPNDDSFESENEAWRGAGENYIGGIYRPS